MHICILDGNEITSREQLHDTLKLSLSLPEWYGRNLDALYDCLTDVREEVEIQLSYRQSLEEHLGSYVHALERAVHAAAESNPRVRWREAG